jgi:ribosomal-protein-alanine N-acetyltransferase
MPACIAALRLIHAYDKYPVTWPDDPAAWLTPRGCFGAWVAVAGDEIVGHMALCLDEDDVPPEIELKRLFVIPAHRGAGYARALLDLGVRETLARGHVPMLQVRDAERTAIALYERLGWKRTDSYRISWPGSRGEHLVHRYELTGR